MRHMTLPQRAPTRGRAFPSQRRSSLCRPRTLVVVTPMLLALPMLALLWHQGAYSTTPQRPAVEVLEMHTDAQPPSAAQRTAVQPIVQKVERRVEAVAEPEHPVERKVERRVEAVTEPEDESEEGCGEEFEVHLDTDFQGGDLESEPVRGGGPASLDLKACCEACKRREKTMFKKKKRKSITSQAACAGSFFVR